MMALWSAGAATVREVLGILNRKEERAYTSVATVLKVLHDKGYVTAEKQDRTLVYAPALSKEDYEGRTLRRLSDTLFGGEPTALIARLVDDEALTEDTIKEIRDIIDTRIGR